MRTTRYLSVILMIVPRLGFSGVSVKKEGSGEKQVVVLENDFIRAVFSPSRGGQCMELVFKPTDANFVLSGEGRLFGNRVWNYDDSKLYFQWQKNPWEYRLRTAKGEASLTLSSEGRVGFTRRTRYEKVFILREGESMLRVGYRFYVGQELMRPYRIGLWFANRCGVVGERTTYFLPLEDGILALEQPTTGGQLWFYNPARGWLALVGEKGNGLCFEMDFRRLMCFYLWQGGTQPTFEWAYRSFEVKNGSSLTTGCLVTVFSGLKRVDGAGNGVVAGLDAPAEITPAKVEKGLTVKASLVSGAALSGELVLSARRLPDTSPSKVLRQKLSLTPGKVSETSFTFKLVREGTWILRGQVIGSSRRLMDFERTVIVGKGSGEYWLVPIQKRLGHKGERFENKITLGSSAPKDIKLSLEVESPHTKWAKPYSKGKTKVLFLTSRLNGREAVELAERMDAEIIWVSTGRGKMHAVEHMNYYIRQKLQEAAPEVVLIGGLRGQLFEEKTIEILKEKVQSGMGLVYVAPNRLRDSLREVLPVGKEIHPRWRAGQWKATTKHFITSGVPLEELPVTDYANIEVNGDVLATVGRKALLITKQVGNGRVVVLNYNTGWQGSGAYKTGITPWVRYAPQKFPYWEYHFSLLIKSILWSARKEPDLLIEEAKAEDRRGRVELTLKLKNTLSALKSTLWLRMLDAYGTVEYEGSSRLRIDAGMSTVTVSLPVVAYSGLHVVDFIIKKGEKVLNWGTVSLHIDRGVEVRSISFDKKAYYPEEKMKVKIEVSSARALEGVMVVEFTDSLGRLIAVSEEKLHIDGLLKHSFEFPVGKPLCTVGKVSARVRDGDGVLAVGQAEFIMLPERFAKRQLDDWASCVWGTPAGAYERDYLIPFWSRLYKEYGIDIVLTGARWQYDIEYESAVRAGFQIMPMGVAFGSLNVGHRAPKGKMPFREARTLYQKTHDKKLLVRPVCLNNPDELKELGQKLKKLGKYAGWLEPIGYNLGDEMSITYYVTPFDYCFGRKCIESFREWLKKRYRTLDALNREWETNFRKWEDVMPMTAYEARKRTNYAPWTDHRQFMDETFMNSFKWVRERLREGDPKATVGLSGSQAAEAYGGYDWWNLAHTLDFIQNYTHQNTAIMQRSFGPDVPRMPWYGYGARNPGLRRLMWWRLLNGNYGGSYFSSISMFYPDGRYSPTTAEAQPIVKEFRNGISRLLKNLQRLNDVGVHYSHPSIRGAFITDASALFRNSRQGWIKLLEDTGFQCEFVATDQLEKGLLGERKYPILLLPYSVAVSAKEAEAIREYVAGGGFLLADGRIALMDEHCRTLKSSPLDELFGVRHDEVKPSSPFKEGVVNLTNPELAGELKGMELKVRVAEPDLKLSGGVALGEVDGSPVIILRRFGQGTALLLNFFLDGYRQKRKERAEKPFIELIRQLLSWRGVNPWLVVSSPTSPGSHFYIVRYRAGRTKVVAVQHDFINPQAEKRLKIKVGFPIEAFLYDIRAGKFLGKRSKVQARMPVGDTRLYALLPYRVTGLKVEFSKENYKPGETVSYRLSVRTNSGEAGLHIFRAEVRNPQGQVLKHYSANLTASSGSAQGGFKLALNDPTGKWEITARDLLTGSKETVSFEVAK